MSHCLIKDGKEISKEEAIRIMSEVANVPAHKHCCECGKVLAADDPLDYCKDCSDRNMRTMFGH